MIKELLVFSSIVATGALLGAGGTLLARRIALRWGVLDLPDGRKVHDEPVPYLGGMGIYAAFLVMGLLGRGLFPRLVPDYEFPEWFVPVMAAGALLLAAGVWDDVKGLSAWIKFPVQIAAVLIVTLFTDLKISYIAHPFGGYIYFGPFSVVVTVLWGVALINAINLIDGLDGLAAGVTALSCTFLFIHDLIQGSPRFLVLALIGICLGFLRYNFSPARIFMGDAGAMFLGLMLAVFSLQVRMKGTLIVTLIFPLMVMGIPLLDTGFAFLRRLSQGKHPFQGDARHLHHRFLALGLTDRQVVLVIYFFCLAFGLFALIMARLTPSYRLLTLLLLVLLIAFVIAAIKHLENQFLLLLEEIRVYKNWMSYERTNNSEGEAAREPAATQAEETLPQAGAKREYVRPALAQAMLERLWREEEQRREDILIIASRPWQERLSSLLTGRGHQVQCREHLPRDLAEEKTRPGVIIIEERTAGKELADFITQTRLTNPKAAVLVLTDSPAEEDTLSLLRLGINTLLPGCASDEVLETLLQNTLESRYLARRLDFLSLVFWFLIFSIPLWIVIGRFIDLGKF